MPATTACIFLAATFAASVAASTAIAASESVIYRFQGGADGADPQAGLINVGGVLWGTTVMGGPNNDGTVFSVTPAGAEGVLFSFTRGANGWAPQAALLNVNGTFYGTTSVGGTGCDKLGCGVVFALTSAGTETVLHAFRGGIHDGGFTAGNMTYLGGKLYGVTLDMGPYTDGSVYAVTLTGHEKMLHAFGGGANPNDGVAPIAGLLDVKGTLYGTTQYGGGTGCGGQGCGTVYTITPAGTEKVLYAFTGGSDGAYPMAPLVYVGGALYGTTQDGGGAGCGGSGCGTVFSITPTGTEQVLYAFTGGTDVSNPRSGLTDVNGALYGESLYGGANGFGAIYKVSRKGVESVVYSFQGGSDGAEPLGGLLNVSGTLYGTTPNGGGTSCNAGDGCGTVFSITP